MYELLKSYHLYPNFMNYYENKQIKVFIDQSKKIANKINESTILKYSLIVALAGPFLFKGMVTYVGFYSTGIFKGTLASKLMASYGGFVTKGSLCAYLQSITTSGLGFKTIFATSSLSFATASPAFYYLYGNNNKKKEDTLAEPLVINN